MKYLITEECCEINHDAAKRKGYSQGTNSIFNCRGGCLDIPEGQEHLLTEEQRDLLVDELPEEFIND